MSTVNIAFTITITITSMRQDNEVDIISAQSSSGNSVELKSILGHPHHHAHSRDGPIPISALFSAHSTAGTLTVLVTEDSTISLSYPSAETSSASPVSWTRYEGLALISAMRYLEHSPPEEASGAIEVGHPHDFPSFIPRTLHQISLFLNSIMAMKDSLSSPSNSLMEYWHNLQLNRPPTFRGELYGLRKTLVGMSRSGRVFALSSVSGEVFSSFAPSP